MTVSHVNVVVVEMHHTAFSGVAFMRPSCRTDNIIEDIALMPHITIDDRPTSLDAAGMDDNNMLDLEMRQNSSASQ